MLGLMLPTTERLKPTEIKALVFIVTYNHENLLKKTIERIPKAIFENPQNEILVIDDGSRDNTFSVALETRRQIMADLDSRLSSHCRFTVLKNPVNQGYGGNQKMGYRYAVDHGFTHVFLVHGDGQYAPELLTQAIDHYSQVATGQQFLNRSRWPDAVFGTRMSSWRSARRGGMPYYKIVGNVILTFIQNKLLKSDLSEFHSGFRSYSTEILKKIPFERNSNDFHFDTDIIIQVLAVGGVIQEFPIPTHYGDEICHVNGFAYAFEVLKSSLHFRLQNAGFLYDRKFDVGPYKLPDKSSSHAALEWIHESLRPKTSVLDLKCGTGELLDFLNQEKKCETYGVDHATESSGLKNAKKYWSIDIHQDLNKLKDVLAEKHFDYILMSDLLEQAPEPEKLLDFLRRYCLLSNDGKGTRVLAKAGNVGFFIVRLMLMIGQFNYTPRGILNRAHKRLFTQKSLVYIFEQCGFRVVGVKTAPLPIKAILKSHGVGANFLESINRVLSRLLPGVFSYQFFIEVEILPTVENLINSSQNFSKNLEKTLQESRHRETASFN
jgi:glycosyltransferase involved in cell wall biosynthesis